MNTFVWKKVFVAAAYHNFTIIPNSNVIFLIKHFPAPGSLD